MTGRQETTIDLRRRTLLGAAVAAIGLAAVPVAQAAAPALAPGLVDLKVVDRDTGEAARVWRRAGRLYVAGRPGARYSVRVTNNSPGRVLAVVSVDGVNILTGETAAYDQRGYVLGPYGTYDATGWRKSDTEVAAFTFAPLSRSYAARTGRPNDVGVIGVAAFAERAAAAVAPAIVEESRPRRESGREDTVVTGSRAGRARSMAAPPIDLPAPPPMAAPAAEKLGTEHGAREWSAVRTVSFERATRTPQLVRRIEYDSYPNLVAAGMIPRPRPTPAGPRPFPSGQGYVPDPPDFR